MAPKKPTDHHRPGGWVARYRAIKAGRPPQPESERKSRNLTFRGRPSLHSRLGRAAVEAGRSVSDEIEYRLERSFAQEESIEAGFGNQEVFELMKAVAATLNAVAGTGHGRLLDDALRYNRAVNAVHGVLDALRPPPTAEDLERIGRTSIDELSRRIREEEKASSADIQKPAHVAGGDTRQKRKVTGEGDR